MKTKIFLLLIAVTTSLIISGHGFSEDDIYYARCNLKVIKGSYITWVNWQSTNTFIRAGAEMRVSKGGRKATLVAADTEKSYTLDIGNEDDIFLEKFVTREKVNISKFPEDVQRNIEKATAEIGMTKEQVYTAMGPPSWAGQKTHSMTFEQIMAEDLWVYKRRRFGKNIGVSFDHKTGKVDRTEGIWRK